MSEKNLEMMKKLIEAKKNKNTTKDANILGKAPNTQHKARKAFRGNWKSGGMFDK